MSRTPRFGRIRKYGVAFPAVMILVTGYTMFRVYDNEPQHVSDYEASSNSHPHKRSTPIFPLVYVADGILECGASLIADQCSANPTTSYSLFTPHPTFHISDQYEYSLLNGEQNEWFLVDNPILTFIIDTSVAFELPATTIQIALTPTPESTRIIKQTAYSPSISTSEVWDSPMQTPTATSSFRNPKLAHRSYEFDPCDGTRPSHDFVSTSLDGICHFIANVQQYFVSLRPAAFSAYLPCWPGYLVQVFIAVLDLFQIVMTVTESLLIISFKRTLRPMLMPSLRISSV
jgi:hypothetical protein